MGVTFTCTPTSTCTVNCAGANSCSYLNLNLTEYRPAQHSLQCTGAHSCGLDYTVCPNYLTSCPWRKCTGDCAASNVLFTPASIAASQQVRSLPSIHIPLGLFSALFQARFVTALRAQGIWAENSIISFENEGPLLPSLSFPGLTAYSPSLATQLLLAEESQQLHLMGDVADKALRFAIFQFTNGSYPFPINITNVSSTRKVTFLLLPPFGFLLILKVFLARSTDEFWKHYASATLRPMIESLGAITFDTPIVDIPGKWMSTIVTSYSKYRFRPFQPPQPSLLPLFDHD